MEFVSILLIALGLSADCFAVTLSASCTNRNFTRLQIFRVAGFFGFFQALMPLLGWLAGRKIVDLIANFDHWVALGLLVFVGGKMLWEAFHHEENEKPVDISHGWMLFTLSVATSLDALAVGLAFAFENVNIWLAISVIGSVSFIIAGIGFLIGRKVGEVFGKRAELIGGLILIGIGIRILLTHLIQ
jgi:putative Mn2+ efflux pump MntP